jgi:uncharacterized protein (DUF885 family)
MSTNGKTMPLLTPRTFPGAVPGLLLPLLLSLVPSAQAADGVAALADRYYAFRLQTRPEIAYFAGVASERHDGLWDNSPAAIAAEQAVEDELLRELASIDDAALAGSADWVTHGFLQHALTSARDLRICRYELWGVSQMDGWQLNYTQLAELQPVGTPELRRQALARWRQLPAWIDREILNLRAGLDAGYSSPQSAVRRVIEQLDGLLAVPAEDSPFASPARRDTDAEFKQAFLDLVRDGILPAARRYRAFLADEYLGRARSELSVTANPDGRACYEASLRSYTTVDRGPEEIYALGQQTVAANRERVIALGRAAYGLDDFAAIIARIKQDPENRFRDKQDLLEFSADALQRSRAAVPQWFGRVPARDAVIEPYPDYQDGTGVSMRYEPGQGERPGVFRISLYQPGEQTRGNAEATAFHEVWPGHHLQVAISQELEAQQGGSLHPISQISWYSGMGEGWARYAEALADEMGLYRTVAGPIGRLAWPARGMVVDPGIHVMGWTREQAIAFMDEAGRMTAHELEEMVDRIAVLPGQLTAYDTGGLEILALRQLAEQRLGAAFDVRAFHDRILENGTVPLVMLRAHIEGWVESRIAQRARE